MNTKRRSHGAGSIRTRTLRDGTLRYDVLIRVPGGKQKQVATCTTADEADAYLTLHAVRRAEAGHFVPADIGVMTLRHMGNLFLDALPAERLVTERSRWRARVETSEMIDWPLTQITEQSIRRWIDKMARTPIASGKSAGRLPSRATIQGALALLRSAFKWAVIAEHHDSNPAKGVSISESTIAAPRSSIIGSVFDYLREDEVRRLLAADLPPTQKAAFTLLAFTGARPKDLYLLTWDRVDVRGARVVYRTHKRDRDYMVSLLPAALDAFRTMWLAAGQPATGLVFPGPSGEPHVKGYDWGWASTEPKPGKHWTGYRERAGIRRPVPLYSLRHTAASHLLLGTELFTGGRRWSPEEVASFLGHADLSTVRKYLVALGIANIRAVEESREALRLLAEQRANKRR